MRHALYLAGLWTTIATFVVFLLRARYFSTNEFYGILILLVLIAHLVLNVVRERPPYDTD